TDELAAPTPERTRRRIFVAYPYELPEADYRRAFAAVEQRFGVTFEFADQMLTDTTVLVKIQAMMRQAFMSLFDLTGWNPNVALELGIAIGAQYPRRLLFDRTHYRNPRDDVMADMQGWDRIQ